MPSNQHPRVSVWSRYWATGVQHSCSGSYASNYDGEVAKFWHDLVDASPEKAGFLDIACGNGPVSRLIFERADVSATIDAIDLAHLEPLWWQELDSESRARIRFHSGVPAEFLPFADASFDVVVSQFGIEYSDLDRSLIEVRRVMRHGGRFAMIVHADESLIIRRAKHDLQDFSWLAERCDIWRLADRMCGLMALAATDAGRRLLASSPQAAADRAEFNRLMKDIAAGAERSPDGEVLMEVLRGLVAVLENARRSGLAEDARRQLQKFHQAIQDSRLRQEELVACALSERQVEELSSRFNGKLEQFRPIHFANGELLGWGLRLLLQS